MSPFFVLEVNILESVAENIMRMLVKDTNLCTVEELHFFFTCPDMLLFSMLRFVCIVIQTP